MSMNDPIVTTKGPSTMADYVETADTPSTSTYTYVYGLDPITFSSSSSKVAGDTTSTPSDTPSTDTPTTPSTDTTTISKAEVIKIIREEFFNNSGMQWITKATFNTSTKLLTLYLAKTLPMNVNYNIQYWFDTLSEPIDKNGTHEYSEGDDRTVLSIQLEAPDEAPTSMGITDQTTVDGVYVPTTVIRVISVEIVE